MSALSAFIQKQRMRWYGRHIDRRHELRRRLAFYVANHGFEIGDYSMGQAEIRLYNPSRLIVGKYCSIAAGATFVVGGNHPTDAVTTSYLDRQGLGPPGYPYTRGDIVVGSDVWIASNAIILSGVTIGDGAVVGAGSVVIEDVAPYTIVFGSPAKVVRKRFSDEIIAALLELHWWDLDREQIEVLRPLLLGRDVGKFIDEVRGIKGLPMPAAASPLVVGAQKSASAVPRAPVAPPMPAASFSNDEGFAIIRKECPSLTEGDLDKSFEDLDVDSFGMLTLRTKLEEASGVAVDDETWSSVATPADAIRIFGSVASEKPSFHATAILSERRTYHVNLPQMAVNGFSESWLFKECGDVHWSLITKGLGIPSTQVRDAAGNRLFATFTRVQIDSIAPLAAYAENEPIAIEGKISRYGPTMFFNDLIVQGEGKSTRVRLMSSFSKFGEAVTNTSLLPGQPQFTADCSIPALADLPDFAQGYGAQRGVPLAPPIFECEYTIVPYHDINGVGLLYFAAFPVINDICASRYAGPSYSQRSTRRRDIFYFANCEADETLIYRVHRWRSKDDGIEAEESLSRKSDGVLIAYTFTTKDFLPADRRHRDRSEADRQAVPA
jgi:probable biosynthetic protein (TIGR04098 family)